MNNFDNDHQISKTQGGGGGSQYKVGWGASWKFSWGALKHTCTFFINHIFTPKRYQNLNSLQFKILSQFLAQKRGKIIENKVRKSLWASQNQTNSII